MFSRITVETPTNFLVLHRSAPSREGRGLWLFPTCAVSAGEGAPTAPNEFAKSLLVKLPVTAQAQTGAATDAWRAKPHTIVVVNSDGQRAEWAIQNPQISSASAVPAGSDFTISVTGTGIRPGATLEARNLTSPPSEFVTIRDFKPSSGTIGPTVPSKWTAINNFKPNRVRVTNPDQQCGESDIS